MLQLDVNSYKYIRFVGDIHGLWKTFEYDIHDVKHFKNSAIIVCGDIGFGFVSLNKEKEGLIKIERKLAENNNCIIVFRGNHDDPAIFEENSEWRSEIEKDCPHIKILPDYSVIKCNEGNILVVGGARSIDKVTRVKGLSWWEGEMVKEIPDNLFNELKINDISINIVCTHTAPLFCQPYNKSIQDQGGVVDAWSCYDKTLKEDNWHERELLGNLYEQLTTNEHIITHWIYGHFHDHFEVDYNNTKCIGLDMCRNNKRYKDYYNISIYLDDWYWITPVGTTGNICKR